jgi:hypothetical protein
LKNCAFFKMFFKKIQLASVPEAWPRFADKSTSPQHAIPLTHQNQAASADVGSTLRLNRPVAGLSHCAGPTAA